MKEPLKIDPKLQERPTECRSKSLEHIMVPELSVIEDNLRFSLDSVSKSLASSSLLDDREMRENSLRAQVVFLESAFDYFCHCILKYGFRKVLLGDWLSGEKYDNFLVPMSVIKQAQSSGDESYYVDFLNRKISPMTFLDPSDLKDNLNLIYPLMLEEVAKMAYPSAKDPGSHLKEKLRSLYERRNRIAHQDDREHASLKRRSITKEEVEGYRDDLALITGKILEAVKAR